MKKEKSKNTNNISSIFVSFLFLFLSFNWFCFFNAFIPISINSFDSASDGYSGLLLELLLELILDLIPQLLILELLILELLILGINIGII